MEIHGTHGSLWKLMEDVLQEFVLQILLLLFVPYIAVDIIYLESRSENNSSFNN